MNFVSKIKFSKALRIQFKFACTWLLYLNLGETVSWFELLLNSLWYARTLRWVQYKSFLPPTRPWTSWTLGRDWHHFCEQTIFFAYVGVVLKKKNERLANDLDRSEIWEKLKFLKQRFKNIWTNLKTIVFLPNERIFLKFLK